MLGGSVVSVFGSRVEGFESSLWQFLFLKKRVF